MTGLLAVKKRSTLEEAANMIIAELQEKFSNAEYIINGEVYGEEDLDIDIYVSEDNLLELDRLASKVSFKYWEETGYNIFPMVAPK